MRYFLFTVLGMFLMFIILKILSSKTVSSNNDTSKKVVALAKTPQFNNVLKTNEARELIKTVEFRKLIESLATDQLKAFSASLVTYSPK